MRLTCGWVAFTLCASCDCCKECSVANVGSMASSGCAMYWLATLLLLPHCGPQPGGVFFGDCSQPGNRMHAAALAC